MGEAFQRSQGKECFFHLPFWMKSQTVRSEQHLQARFAMLAARMHVRTHGERQHVWEGGKKQQQRMWNLPRGRKNPLSCLQKWGTDEWEGRGFIFSKRVETKPVEDEQKQDRVWERRILQPQNQSTIPLSGRWNAEALCTVSQGCEVNPYLRLSPVSFCIERKESFDEGWLVFGQ